MSTYTVFEKNLPALYGLRAIFCIGIVIYHVNEHFGNVFSGWSGAVCKYGGYFGNYIFFMLSGLLMAYHYKKRLLEKEYTFFSFMSKRIKKIYPMYFFSNLFVMILCRGYITLEKTISTFFIVSNGWYDGIGTPYNFPAWFLCILLICYILYFLIGRISTICGRLYLPLCSFFVVWGMLLEKLNVDIPFSYRTCGEGYMNFFAGVLLAELFMNKSVSRKNLLIAGYIALSAGIICLCNITYLQSEIRWIISTICAGLICIILFGCKLNEFLSKVPFRFVGYCSFSVYLWHFPVIQWLIQVEKNFRIIIPDDRFHFIIYFVLLSVVSAISFYIFERKNFLKINKEIPDEVIISKSKVEV